MTICHNPDCPTSHDLDQFGRRMSVQHNGITQSVLKAAGHHLLNRYFDGSLRGHLLPWTASALARVEAELHAERTRVSRYAYALEATERQVRARREALKTR
jgi:hypothetical protein